jgi:hypothetical protein
MQVDAKLVGYVRSAVVVIAISVLFATASVLLFVSVGFGFTAGEMLANPPHV